MKPPMVPILALILAATPATARIGETPQECTKRYGKVTSFTDQPKSISFEKKGITIVTQFHDGKCDCIHFFKLQPEITPFTKEEQRFPMTPADPTPVKPANPTIHSRQAGPALCPESPCPHGAPPPPQQSGPAPNNPLRPTWSTLPDSAQPPRRPPPRSTAHPAPTVRAIPTPIRASSPRSGSIQQQCIRAAGGSRASPKSHLAPASCPDTLLHVLHA